MRIITKLIAVKEVDQDIDNGLLDNVMYYILEFTVRSLEQKLKCKKCNSELLHDADHQHSFRFHSVLYMLS